MCRLTFFGFCTDNFQLCVHFLPLFLSVFSPSADLWPVCVCSDYITIRCCMNALKTTWLSVWVWECERMCVFSDREVYAFKLLMSRPLWLCMFVTQPLQTDWEHQWGHVAVFSRTRVVQKVKSDTKSREILTSLFTFCLAVMVKTVELI